MFITQITYILHAIRGFAPIHIYYDIYRYLQINYIYFHFKRIYAFAPAKNLSSVFLRKDVRGVNGKSQEGIPTSRQSCKPYI